MNLQDGWTRSGETVEAALHETASSTKSTIRAAIRVATLAGTSALGLLALTAPAEGQAVDAVSTGTTEGTEITISHTTSGSDRLMVVGVSFRNEEMDKEWVASVTYNGVSLSLVAIESNDNDARAEVWQLTAPPTGTHNVVITFSKDLKKAAVAGVITFTGVDQSTPIGTFAAAQGKSLLASVDISSSTDELVLGVIAAKKPEVLSAGVGQTVWWDLSEKKDEAHGAGSTEPGATSVTTSWTLNREDRWALIALTIRAKPTVPPDPPPPCERSVRDEFTSIVFSGNNGSVDWNTDWQEIGETDGAGSGLVQVISPIGCASGNCIRIGGTNASIDGLGLTREVDLSGASLATLTFTVARVNSGGGVTLAVSNNGGFSWTTLASYAIGSGTPLSATTQSFDLTDYIAANTRIRFLAVGSTGDPSYIYFDEVDITFTGGDVSATATAPSATRLPSNGTQYVATYTVTNSGFGTDDFDLLTTHPGAGVTTVSIAGPSITQGEVPDSALLTGLAVGDSTLVTVTYLVADVAAGTTDSLALAARSRCNPATVGSGLTVVSVVRPAMNTTKAVATEGEPIPGTDLSYTLTISNDGSEQAYDVVILDSLAVEVQFKVGSVINNLPAGVAVVVEYSNDAAASWAYTPTSEGCGAPVDYDGCVTHIRWRLQDPLGYSPPDNTANVKFVARIE